MLIAWLADRHSHKQWQYMRLVFSQTTKPLSPFCGNWGLVVSFCLLSFSVRNEQGRIAIAQETEIIRQRIVVDSVPVVTNKGGDKQQKC